MNGLIAWWARNTVAANLLMIFIFFAGFAGYSMMEREMEPQVQFSGLQVQVTWPGASPREVEEQIVSKIEARVADLDNIDWTRSQSREGVGFVWIRGDIRSATDFAETMDEVKSRVNSISSFPRDIEPPVVQRWENTNEFIRIGVHGNLDEKSLTNLAKDLRLEVEKLPAISRVQLFGIRNEEVSIEVSEDALRRYGLSFQDVANAIRSTSLNISSGTIRTEAGEKKIVTRNQANSKADFENIVVRQNSDGATIRVGDIADVIDGFVDNPILATMNGDPAVLIQVLTTETMDVVTASNGVSEWIENRSKTLPSGVTLTLWNDTAEAFKGRMSTIINSAGLGLILVMIVLLLTLRPKVALWVGIGIGTAYLGAFIFLDTVGVSLNMISTFAFLLVLGIVVDDAIVVGESIHHEAGKTGGGLSASILGTQLVAKPVIFAVLTTIIAFMPWIFISGETSEFTRQITWVVILALVFSLVESLLILPAHLSKMKPRKNLSGFGKFQKRIADAIINVADKKYRKWGERAVEYRYFTLIGFISFAAVLFSLVPLGYVKFGFMPEIDSDEISIDIKLPEGTPYSEAQRILKVVQNAEKKLVDEAAQESGGKEQLIENWYTRSRRDSVLAMIKLTPPELRGEKSAKEIALRLRELVGEIPVAEEVNVRYTLNDGGPGMQYAITHNDLDILQEAVTEVEKKLRTYSELYDVRNNLQSTGQEISITLLPGAEKLGLNLRDVSRQVRQAYFGEEVQRLARNGEDVKAYVRYPLTSRRSMESLKNFRVQTPSGEQVPLLSIAELGYRPGITGILHWDRDRSAIISADLKDDVGGKIRDELDKEFWPKIESEYPGLKRIMIGQAEGERRFFEEVQTLYLMAFFVMYMMLAIAFHSYSQPLLILIAIPFAYVGAIVGHAVMGQSMALFSFFGIAAAAGVVVNDNLVLVDYYNRLRERGMPARQAIVEAGVTRFRPILLTSVTTFVGLVPMMLEKSIQAAFLQPIVISLAFGVLLAFFVTLLLVPAMCSIGVDYGILKQRVKDWFTAPWRDADSSPSTAHRTGIDPNTIETDYAE